MQWHGSSIINDVKSCTCFDEQLHTCIMAIKNRTMKWCASRIICDVNICTRINEHLYARSMIIMNRVMQRGPP
ncbi:hypothetical protein PBCV1_a006L [Paramecium bursaria Chlorella virus 1]|uniref:Uncharacterized protein n=1 Tax=Paramecium bursaria Chlorella virus 1 TaxID=10506 RepID=Q89341_PBCV1|nr:hypothetical protein PBCV1_a006L [Paramecium bursaria Chlorella virus 1]AAC96374.2 hypothetical protein [Paramecium bursaria Chlorella virus 1]